MKLKRFLSTKLKRVQTFCSPIWSHWRRTADGERDATPCRRSILLSQTMHEQHGKKTRIFIVLFLLLSLPPLAPLSLPFSVCLSTHSGSYSVYSLFIVIGALSSGSLKLIIQACCARPKTRFPRQTISNKKSNFIFFYQKKTKTK